MRNQLEKQTSNISQVLKPKLTGDCFSKSKWTKSCSGFIRDDPPHLRHPRSINPYAYSRRKFTASRLTRSLEQN